MSILTKSTAIFLASALLIGAAAPADAARINKLQDSCEEAVQTEFDAGRARINRVTVATVGDQTTFWMTVRHKAPTEAKSTRYRAKCTIDKSGGTAGIDIEPGWWQRTGRSAPVPVD